MIRVDYINKNNKIRHTFIEEENDLVGFEILQLVNRGVTDIHIYKIKN